MTVTKCDIAIVGAGAAGLTAAIFAKRTAPGARVIALDGAPKIGAKILISGGGRCNVTHDVVTPDDFHGNRNAIAKVLRTFSVSQTLEWFASMGVQLKREETGKMFPVTDRARSVVEGLLAAARDVEIRTGWRVSECGGTAAAFTVEATPRPARAAALPPHSETIIANRIILAAGGRSVPKTGSDGHGYTLARSLGHSVTEVFPALVPLVLEENHWLTKLSGTSVEAELAVLSSTQKVLARERGSLLFTHFGISGPAALDVSRHWIAARRDDPRASLVARFVDDSFEELEKAMIDEARRNPRATAARFFRGRIPERLLAAIAGEPQPLGKLTKDERRRILRALTALPVPVVRDRGFDYAEVTAGGVPLSEVDVSTMASRKCSGLYLCGEILDVDGKIGGYNFQWAWASGRLAGIHAAGS